MADENPLLVIVTGVSGAGRSVAIKSLEDCGFYCIDNVPSAMIDASINFFKNSKLNFFAIGMDIRDQDFVDEFESLKTHVQDQGIRLDVLFLTANDDVLAVRYSATRRKHPLLDTGGELISAIRREKKMLSPIEKNADESLDTSLWSPHYLARMIEKRYASDKPGRHLFVNITSFGFKHGPLRPVDNLYDVRFLKNPYFDPNLKEKTGLSPEIKEFVFSDERTGEFMDKLVTMNQFLLPHYYYEGKHYLRIGIGCTGGMHRSVCLAEELGHRLTDLNIDKVLVSVLHRDLPVS